MAKVPLSWLELHSELFLGGKNFKKRLPAKEFPNLAMSVDDDAKLLYLSYNGHNVELPLTSAFLWSKASEAPQPLPPPVPPKSLGFGEAQVSTPQSHVFEGPGKGKKGELK